MKRFLFYFALLISCFGLTSTAIAYDNDLWARLIVGNVFFQTGHILKTDFLSYISTHTWWDHEWGASIIFSVFQNIFGHFGFVILHAMLLFATMYFIVKVVKLRNPEKNAYNLFYFFIVLNVMYIAVKSPVRCQMFSFLFFTIFIWLLEKYKITANKKLLYPIPVITLFWANIHGGVVSGIGLLIIYIVGEFLSRRPVMPYIKTFLISFLTMFINPYGIEYVLFLLYANTMKRPMIIEWWSVFHPVIRKSYVLFDIWAVVTIIMSIVSLIKAKFKNIDFTKFILIFATIFMAVTHVKLIPLAVITGSIFLYEDFTALFKNLKIGKYAEIYVYIAVIVTFIFSFDKTIFQPILTWSIYPIKETEFIKINNLKGNLFAAFGQGSFLEYKLYPHNKLYMDGRYEEVFYDSALEDMKKFVLMEPDWDYLLKKYNTDVLLLEKNYPVFSYIEKYTDWVKVYEGPICGVFVKKSELKKNYIQPSDDLEYYRKHLFDTEAYYND
ncbi:hypothetical protein IJI31_04940 [bacterium]|nr:hypothetical protein [bacterium]